MTTGHESAKVLHANSCHRHIYTWVEEDAPMDAQAIALPRGTALLWIRVGELLDAAFAYRPDEVVQRIVKIVSGFRVDTRDMATGTIRCYEAPCFFVSQAEPLFEDSVPHLDDTHPAGSTEESLMVRAYRTYGV